MNKARIADLYATNATVRAILDIFADRTNNSTRSRVSRIHYLLKQTGVTVSWRELIAALRLLQEAGCGIFVKGSRGYSSRFEWAVKTTQIAALAHELLDEEDEEEEDGEDEDEDEDDEEDDEEALLDTEFVGIDHPFVLRPMMSIVVRAPIDMNQLEADRLAQFTETLSFSDPYGDEDDEDEEDYDDEEIAHDYMLRPDLRVTLRLPADLSPREATRIAQFIRALPFSG